MASFFETVRRFRPERYHKQKLALLLSAMRHDALTRGSRGHPVLYRFSERWYDGALAEVRETFAIDRVEVRSRRSGCAGAALPSPLAGDPAQLPLRHSADIDRTYPGRVNVGVPLNGGHSQPVI